MKPRIKVKAADETEMNNRVSRERKIACNRGSGRAGRGLKLPGKSMISALGRTLRFTSDALKAATGFCADVVCTSVFIILADTGLLPTQHREG
jgi:hypothetical protein